MAIPAQSENVQAKEQLTSSLAQFYDDIVYWEIAKKSNRFFVTFEKGRHGIPNHKLESIGTMEITYPHVNSNTGSFNAFGIGVTRDTARYDAFLEQEEKFTGNQQKYDGFITTTELKGTRFYQTTLTSSQFQSKTIDYQIYSGSAIVSASRTISASYFYPYSSHQLSVLRKSPTLIIDLDVKNELPNNFNENDLVVLLPEHTHPNIKENLSFWLAKAGYGK